jgi:hypothetical protein
VADPRLSREEPVTQRKCYEPWYAVHGLPRKSLFIAQYYTHIDMLQSVYGTRSRGTEIGAGGDGTESRTSTISILVTQPAPTSTPVCSGATAASAQLQLQLQLRNPDCCRWWILYCR